MAEMTWNGQGPVYIGTYDPLTGSANEGFLTKLRRLPCSMTTVSHTLSRETKKIKESCSGQRLDADEIETGKSMEVKLTMARFSTDEMSEALYGTKVAQASGSVTNEVLRAGLLAGEYVFLKHGMDVSVLVITDSAGTPATLVADTHYTVVDAKNGVIKIINPATFVQPFKAAYAHTGYDNVTAFTKTTIEQGIIGTFKNGAGNTARLMIPRMRLAQDGDFNWLSDEESPLSFTGSVFYVPEFENDATFGQFARVIWSQ